MFNYIFVIAGQPGIMDQSMYFVSVLDNYKNKSTSLIDSCLVVIIVSFQYQSTVVYSYIFAWCCSSNSYVLVILAIRNYLNITKLY